MEEEVMSEAQTEIVEADRVIFKEVNDNELSVINKHKMQRAISAFYKRMLISAIVILVVYLIQVAGWILKDNSIKYVLKHKSLIVEALKEYALLAIAAFIIYNCVSAFYTFVKTQLVSLTENYYILLEAKAEEKYDGRKLHAEGKGRKKNYVVFSCDQGVCSKAIETDRRNYKNTKIGDSIVVLKSITVDGYTLKYLRLDEYNSIYNKYKLNA